MLLLTACSKDNDETVTVETPTGVATVTYLVTPNGLGDNSYNDAAAEGIFAFAHVTGTRLRMLQPKDEAEAGTMYRQWLTDNATKDSAVLIIGSSAYEAIARQTSAAEQDRLQSLKERGGRVLLFESDADIEGISTVIISRYGVSYLAGAMSQNFNALVMSAVKDNPLLDEAISGFLAGYDAHHAEGTAAEVFYLSDGVAGFAMPDSAYHFMGQPGTGHRERCGSVGPLFTCAFLDDYTDWRGAAPLSRRLESRPRMAEPPALGHERRWG